MKTSRGFLVLGSTFVLAATTWLASAAIAQDTTTSSSVKSEQWINVRVESKEDRGETVRVNVPVEMAAKVIPAINKNNLHDGKVRIDSMHTGDVDLRVILDAVRSSRDGEYVTVQNKENDVRVAKSAGYLYIHVTDKSEGKKEASKDEKTGAKAGGGHGSKEDIKGAMKGVEALFSAGKGGVETVAAAKTPPVTGDTGRGAG